MKYVITENQFVRLRRVIDQDEYQYAISHALKRAIDFYYDAKRFIDYEVYEKKVLQKATDSFLVWNTSESEYSEMLSSENFDDFKKSITDYIKNIGAEKIRKHWESKMKAWKEL